MASRILERVRAKCGDRRESLVAISDLLEDRSLGERIAIEAALRELILSGDLDAVRFEGVHLTPGTEGGKKRRTALLSLTKKVFVDISGHGEPLDVLIDAIRIVDGLER
ncbi:MAG: hypothetical protein ACAI25_16060 [Planctomycetota bacterium]